MTDASRLMATTTVNVFVGSRPDLDLVFAVPKGILCHFSPLLRQQLVMEHAKVVVLHMSDKRSVSWVCRWMLAGGQHKATTTAAVPETDEEVMGALLHKLQVADELRILPLCAEVYGELSTQFTTTSLTVEQVRWAYSHRLSLIAKGLRAAITEGVVNSALDYDLIYPIALFREIPLLYHDTVTMVDSQETVKRVGAVQRTHPLSVDQIKFLYEFCACQGHLRKTIAHGLLKLITDGKVWDENVYRSYGWENDEFDGDMNDAIETSKRAADHTAYLERKARRDAKSAAVAAAAASAAASAGAKGKAVAKSTQRGPVAGKGIMAAVRNGTKGLRASGSTTVEPTPGKPAQRVKSDVILRLDLTGAVTRER